MSMDHSFGLARFQGYGNQAKEGGGRESTERFVR